VVYNTIGEEKKKRPKAGHYKKRIIMKGDGEGKRGGLKKMREDGKESL